jgi:hypothetical protein
MRRAQKNLVISMAFALLALPGAQARDLTLGDDVSDILEAGDLSVAGARDLTLIRVKSDQDVRVSEVIVRLAPESTGRERLVSVSVDDHTNHPTVITLPELPTGKTISERSTPIGTKKVVVLSGGSVDPYLGGEVTMRLLRAGGLVDDKRNLSMYLIKTGDSWSALTSGDKIQFDSMEFHTNGRGIIGVDILRGGHLVKTIDTADLPK